MKNDQNNSCLIHATTFGEIPEEMPGEINSGMCNGIPDKNPGKFQKICLEMPKAIKKAI